MFISKHRISCDTVNGGWTISTGNGMMYCNKVCGRCLVVICEKEFLTNFLMIDDCDFDVILGMDWLSRMHAFIICQKKIVVFQIPHHLKFKFPGEGRISNQVPHQDTLPCGILATLDMGKQKAPEVVREFLDVLLEDFPRFSPDRKVEFTTDVLPDTAPIPKALYWMAPVELAKGKKQIHELLSKGFIRPSLSL